MHRSDCKSVCYDDVLLELQSNKGLLSQAKNQHHDSNTNCTASGAVSSNLLSRPTFETLAVFAIHKGGGSLSLHPNKTILRSCRDESPLQTSLQLPPSTVVDVGSLPQHDTLGAHSKITSQNRFHSPVSPETHGMLPCPTAQGETPSISSILCCPSVDSSRVLPRFCYFAFRSSARLSFVSEEEAFMTVIFFNDVPILGVEG